MPDRAADGPTLAADAFERRAWGEVHRRLRARPADDLTAADLERLATASYLTGEDDDAVAAWEQAHRRHAAAGDRAEAGRCGFWAAFCLMIRGQGAQAGGWFQRTGELIGDLECAASGYLLIPAVLGALDGGDAAAARDLAAQAGRIAERFDDRDLAAFSTLGRGQALLALDEEAAGLSLFDDAMLSVRSGDVGPVTSGIVYCAVVLECMQIYDLARAAEWTAALDAWCRSQPDLVPYRGQCLVHQSQLQQAAGDWSRAISTVASARDRLADPPHPALGLACYQEGELHRLRGELDAAAAAYRRANRAGYEPMPGLALLAKARGDLPAATAGIRRALAEATQMFRRPPLLAAAVEILVAAGDPAAAHEAADELAAVAARSSSPALHAMAEQAAGSVLLAEGTPSEALAHLRTAGEAWLRLRMPYEAARVAVLRGRGCLAMGDRASARLELDSARETLASLGAGADLAELSALAGDWVALDGADGAHIAEGALSVRELQVLAHVADGKTNRQVADDLSISPHTVRRHLENIFAKLGVSGRAAATAYAYEHDLL
jgi:DNA-binding CsgD family transcriptional regulator/tetratricopeptide (TPR) repeat protein